MISFESNGGTQCSDIRSTDINSIRVPQNPTRDGYEFIGWYWDDGVWKKEFTINSLLDQPLSDRMNLIVYARWLKEGEELPDDETQPEGEIPVFTRTFIIHFDSNGGTPAEPINSENLSTAPIPRPTKENFLFMGWYWDNEMHFTYSSINNRPLTEFPDLTVFAKWKGVDCTINFNADGGTVSPLSKTVEYMSKGFTLPLPTKTESVFEGWYFDAECTQRATEGSSFIIFFNEQWKTLSPTTLYAKWSPKPYSITFAASLGTFPDTNSSFAHIAAYKGQTIDLPIPVREGYNFEGWFTQPEGGGTEITATYIYNGEFNSLYAHWQVKKYKIYFDEQGGTLVEDITVEFRGAAFFDSIYSDYWPEKKGYLFEGWYYQGERVFYFNPYLFEHDVTLTAHWILFGHEVTFVAGDGGQIYGQIGANGWFGIEPDDIITSYVRVYEDGETLFSWIQGSEDNFNILSRWAASGYKFYEFSGWFTEPNGQGDCYMDDFVFRDYTPKTITLYAHFTQYFHIEFSSNYPEFTGDAKLLVYREKDIFFESQHFSTSYHIGDTLFCTQEDNYLYISALKEGYTFAGWYTQPNGGGIQYVDDMVFNTETLSYTLYAYFIPNS